MQLGRKLAQGYAVDVSDEPERGPAVPAPAAAATVVASDEVAPADTVAEPVQV